ncbi:two-component sensor histidine kinase [Caenimonas sedimenti]|uniref:histidine kinase n=1 Tax=Caenimonas sedimenti TaxID=2596921 RepID=A0A562ZFW3_9BURK|nr:ATP-binding protein [Caenimonas sedimenti]TWO66157.1 two-component sensor histidine kinase [Caenimonas sedimenti]
MKWHVFPRGRLCSLRRALMLWLLPLFLLVGVASASFSYWTYSRMVSGFMDEQMQQLGHSVAANEDHLTLPQLNAERVHKWGAYVTQVFDADGKARVTSFAQATLPLQPAQGFHDVRQDGRRWRVFVVPPAHAGGTSVQILQSDSFRAHLAAERAGAAIAPVLILLPLSMLVLWGVARAMSAALQEIGREAAKQDEHSIAELSLERVPQEMTPLVTSFNSLLKRLRDAFATQRRFVQDAAHELRTPIAAIGLQLENLRGDLAPGPAAAQRFAQLESGVRRAQRLVDQLLRLSRQEAAGADGPGMVDLQSQLRESISTLIALADQRHIDLGFVSPEQAAQPMTLRCVPGDLRSLLDNLIENALRYTPEGGVVDVRLLEERGRLAVEVVDTGPGIPHEMLPRVFDRFFRVPGNGANGSGLGLSIARSAAERCGLSLTLRNREDRSGLIARIE